MVFLSGIESLLKAQGGVESAGNIGGVESEQLPFAK
jgi:hypothetical protein